MGHSAAAQPIDNPAPLDFGNGDVPVKCFSTCACGRMAADLIMVSFLAVLLSPLPSYEITPGTCFGPWSARGLPT